MGLSGWNVQKPHKALRDMWSANIQLLLLSAQFLLVILWALTGLIVEGDAMKFTNMAFVSLIPKGRNQMTAYDRYGTGIATGRPVVRRLGVNRSHFPLAYLIYEKPRCMGRAWDGWERVLPVFRLMVVVTLASAIGK